MGKFFLIMFMLALTGCSVLPPTIPQGITSAAGSAPGYYPGLEQPVPGFARAEWESWINTNITAIRDIADKTEKIHTGKLEPGCLGREIHTCIATLSQTLATADYYAVSELFKPEKVDVNGNKLFERVIFISGFLPGAKDWANSSTKISFIIQLNDDHLVKSITTSLPKNLFFAKTQGDYDATGFYEVISTLGKTDCPTLTRRDTAIFIENNVKPKKMFHGSETICSQSSGCTTEGNTDVKNISFCGQMMDFISTYGNASDLGTMSNLHGAYSGMTVTFK